MSNILSLNIKNLYSDDGGGYFIKSDTKTDLAEKLEKKITQVEGGISSQKYGFIEALKEEKYLNGVEEIAGKIKWAKNLVVIGIGGSDLGGRTIIEALEADVPTMKVFFVGDSTDPVAFSRLLKKIDLKETIFNVVSKSGGTLETLSTYVFFKNQIKKIAQNWQKHFVFTTSEVSGLLKKEAGEHKVLTLPVPEDVGGRFSVLTPVGLLPAIVAGVDIKRLVQGGLDFAQDEEMRKLAQDFAKSQFELYSQDIKVVSMIVYSVQLQEFARWFRQLWAESLGKDNKGILPVKAWGPAHQHSQEQFYTQGSPLQSALFVKIKERQTNFKLSNIDIEEAKYLEGKDFNSIINIECDASAQSLFKSGRPNAMLAISKLDAYSLGQLFMLFELSVVYLAEMLEVNVFDQPGVEAGKKIINKALGK